MSETGSKSIWNETPTVYISVRNAISALLTCFYPFLFYVVLFRSPKTFGSLKWFLLFHVTAITLQWLSAFVLIDFWTFVPGKITRINGFLVNFIDAKILFRTTYFLNSVASASCLLLFWNRIFSIVNMYRGVKTRLRRTSEVVLYALTVAFSCSIVVSLRIPDQAETKSVTRAITPFYPDCLDAPQVIVLIVPYPEVVQKATISFIIFLLLTSLMTVLSAQLAYNLLSRRMQNQSAKTRRMHKRFNERTLIQVLVDNSFSSIPFLISNLATLLQWKVPELTYLVDVLAKNNPTACFLVLILYYDPYYQWLITSINTLMPWQRNSSPSTATSIVVKSVDN